MIAICSEVPVSAAGQSQLERKELAKGSWRQGQIENALILIDTILGESMESQVAVQCWIVKAVFQSDQEDYAGALASLNTVAPHYAGSPYVQGTFFNERARAYKALGETDAALTDYAGAAACFELAGHMEYQGAVALNVAGLSLSIDDLTRANENIDRAIKIFTATDSAYLCQAYDSLAQIRLAEGRIEAAMIAVSKALSLAGENELWRQTFIETKASIKAKLLKLLGVEVTTDDLNALQVAMVRQALIAAGGNLTGAGNLLSMTHKGVSYIVDCHAELEQYRVRRRVRRKNKGKVDT